MKPHWQLFTSMLSHVNDVQQQGIDLDGHTFIKLFILKKSSHNFIYYKAKSLQELPQKIREKCRGRCFNKILTVKKLGTKER